MWGKYSNNNQNCIVLPYLISSFKFPKFTKHLSLELLLVVEFMERELIFNKHGLKSK